MNQSVVVFMTSFSKIYELLKLQLNFVSAVKMCFQLTFNDLSLKKNVVRAKQL